MIKFAYESIKSRYMKNSIILRSIFLFSLMITMAFAYAQEDQKIKIKIKTSEDGKTTEITKDFDGTEAELQEYLKAMRINIDIKDDYGDAIEVIITRNEDDDPNGPSLFRSYAFSDCDENKAFLGIKMKDSMEDGVMVTEVIENTGAESAGILANDIITSIDNEKVGSYDDVVKKISSMEPGDEVKIELVRDGKKKNVKATLGEKKNEFFQTFDFDFDTDEPNIWVQKGGNSSQAFLGVSPGCSDKANGEGVYIGHVTPGSSAEKAGLLNGDIVKSINGTTVNSFSELSDQIGESNPDDPFTLVVNRNEETLELSGTMGKRSYGGCGDNIFNLDKLGDMEFDFDFDMEDMEGFDAEEFEERMEQLSEELENRFENMNFEFDHHHDGAHARSMTVVIMIEDLTQEECEKVNENAEHKISPVSDLELEEINFYPNPSNGVFTLNFDADQRGDITLNIYDQAGNTVYKEMLADFSGNYVNEIDISDRSNGAYYLQIIQNGKSLNKKIIKQ